MRIQSHTLSVLPIVLIHVVVSCIVPKVWCQNVEDVLSGCFFLVDHSSLLVMHMCLLLSSVEDEYMSFLTAGNFDRMIMHDITVVSGANLLNCIVQ